MTEPPSIRFNNPGAINGNATWVKAFPGFKNTVVIGGGNPIAVMDTPEHGVALFWTLLKRYRASGAKTVKQIIVKYGGGQANYEAQYLPTVVKWIGLPEDTEIRLDDDAGLLKFAKAMFRYEAGKPTPLSDAVILSGFSLGRRIAAGDLAKDTGVIAVPVGTVAWPLWDFIAAHPLISFIIIGGVIASGVYALRRLRNSGD